MLEEQLVALGVLLHQLHCRRALREQDLIGAQEALLCDKVLEVEVVELQRTNKVKNKEVLVAAGLGAVLPELRGVGRVQCAIGEPVAGLVVEPLPEAGAPRISDGVTPYIGALNQINSRGKPLCQSLAASN